MTSVCARWVSVATAMLRILRYPQCRQILPLSAAIGPPLVDIQSVPITYRNRQADPEPRVKLPFVGPGSPTVASLVSEQRRHCPLVCGLQLENFDDDTRTGTIAGGHII